MGSVVDNSLESEVEETTVKFSQVLELTPNTNDIDDVKQRLLKQDGIIQELRGNVEVGYFFLSVHF